MTTSPPRERKATGTAAAFFSGPAEFLDFVLPIYAGAALGASGAQIGVLGALELVVSLALRPLAGRCVDALAGSGRQRWVAALGAVLYGVAFLGYAWAPSIEWAYGAAALGGAGGAFFWVALRAVVAARSGSGRFAALMEDESTGAWVAFLVGMPLMSVAGATITFLAGAASCLVAAASFALVPASPRSGAAGRGPLPRALRPLLVLTAVVGLAEGAIGLLLMLHLSQGLGLPLGQVAFVYLPGAIVLSVAPRPLHRLMRRRSPRFIAVVGLASSALFAALMSVRPEPWFLAVLWVLSALSWSLLVPLLERLVAEVAPEAPGRAFGRYQSAEMAGTAAGVFLAGVAFSAGAWVPATLGATVLLVAAAAFGTRGLSGFRPASEVAGPALPEEESHHGDTARVARSTPRATTPEIPAPTPTKETTMPITRLPRRLRGIAAHIALYLVAQVVFLVVADSWPIAVIQGRTEVTTLFTWTYGDGVAKFLASASRIWTIVVVADIIWTGIRLLAPARGEAKD